MRLSNALASLALVLVGRASHAEPCHADPRDVDQPIEAGADPGHAGVRLADDPLVDQDGRAVRLPEALAGKVVVVDFVFTRCTTVCPVLSSLFGALQQSLGPLVGREVLLVSVSLDPEHDTPPRLRAYAARHGAGVGWRWITGASPPVRRVLQGFGAAVAAPATHTPFVLVGDVAAGRWTRFNGFPSKARIEARVRELLTARAAKVRR
jgi:protein SCO1/2